MQNQQPSGVTIVNGAPSVHAADHSRKQSVTISSAGTTGFIPNGGPAGNPNRNSIQFGSVDQQNSPAMGSPAIPVSQPHGNLNVAQPVNPRITSPSTSPSPIPQPASSGGRPPSTYQAPGNAPNFGSFGDASGDARQRMNQNNLGPGPQATHLRRESSQSQHSDMGGHIPGGPGGPARGGYQGGRGRGYSGSGYQNQMGYSSGPNFRGTPNQRGGPQMAAPFHPPNHGRPMGYPSSPHQANRSPAIANANPVTPQMSHVPMQHPQMANQHYGAYNQHMGPQNNYPHGGYDPNGGYYYPAYGVQQNMYMPPSPQPRPGIPFGQPNQFMPNQFPAGAVQSSMQSTPLSRSTSQVSNDRPGSSLGQGPAPAVAPTPGHAHTESRTSNSPAPQKNHFIIPTPKKSAIVIKDPNSGVVKSFEKPPASPARATPSPVKGSAPTPPPRAASGVDHTRTESKSVKTDEEKKKELRDAVRMKIEQEEAEQRRKEEDARKAIENLSIADKDDSKAKAEPAPTAPVKEEVKPKVEEPVEEKKPEEKAAPAAPAAPAADDEIDFDAIEREMAEIEAREAAAEAEYQKKKDAQKAEADRKKKEEEEAYERNMKQAEREAEALEEARVKKLESGGAAEEDSSKLFASLRKGGLPASESPAPDTPDDSGAATPVSQSDASMGPPSKPASVSKAKPGPLKLETKPVEPPQPSAALKSLHSAKFLDSLAITYPSSIASPNPALNANAPADRKFKYNKEFLLQFQNVFKEKPTLDWDLRVRETVGDSGDTSRPQSARTPGTGRTTSRGGIPSTFKMGTFGGGTPSVGTPRDAFPNPSGRMPSMGSGPFGTFGRPGSMGPGSMSRPGSSAPMHNVPQSPRPGSSRNTTRTGSRRDKQSSKKEEETNKSMPLTAGLSLKPLEVSTSGWKPRSIGQTTAGPTPGGESEYLAPDVVQRKVKSNLNKMTPENFDRISEQILNIVSQSKHESDGRTLRQVIQLTFEKATDEAHWAPMYAKFCKRMLESMSPEIKDENIKDKAGNVVAGGSLFRKYLLNRCQEEFERGWKVNLPPKPEGESEAAALMSDEYYIAAAAKRRGLGLVKFIGELYKLGMLTERIMHECVKKLVDYEGIPDEAEVESLTSLLRTIGASLDVSEKGHAMMDAYFGRITMMMDTPNLPSRLRFMLLDVVDLRSANWVSKNGDKGPKTLTEIREEAARAQQEAEMERLRQQASRGGGRMPMGRGDARNFSGDYRNQAPPPDFASSKVGSDDLRRLKTSRTLNQPASFGPSSMFGSRSSSGRKNLGPGGNLVRGGEDSGASSRTGTPPAGKKDEKEVVSSINAFSALAALDDNMATSPPSNPTSPELTKSQPVKSEGETA
jgi:translation initiation factor 4G